MASRISLNAQRERWRMAAPRLICGHTLTATLEGSRHGLRIMDGTSSAMMPPNLLDQHCDIVDLNGSLFLESDRESPVVYAGGESVPSSGLWGSPCADRK